MQNILKKKIPIGQALGGHKKSCNRINNNFSIVSKKIELTPSQKQQIGMITDNELFEIKEQSINQLN